jgi:hypothetical protein
MRLFASKRRTRAINFRLSEEEFEELKRACAARGARSLSDFARTAVWRMITHGLDTLPLGAVAEDIDGRLDKLQQQLNQLAGLIHGSDLRGANQPALAESEGHPLQSSSGFSLK